MNRLNLRETEEVDDMAAVQTQPMESNKYSSPRGVVQSVVQGVVDKRAIIEAELA